MNTRFIILLLCAGALAFACGPRSHSAETPAAFVAEQSPATPGSPVERTRHSTRSGQQVAQVQLDSKFNVDVAKERVRFALDVKNVGKKHAELNFPNGQSYDFVVMDSTGREVWHWSTTRMFTQSVQNKQLGAGEAMEVTEAWKPTARGKYTAVATLKSSNYPIEQRAEFVLP